MPRRLGKSLRKILLKFFAFLPELLYHIHVSFETVKYIQTPISKKGINMIFVIAPDSFKGSLTAIQFCDAAEQALLERFPGMTVRKIPMADGGEGTVDALTQSEGGRKRACWVSGPLGDQTMAAYGLMGDGKTAVIEMSAAAGLPLLPAWKRDPFAASTWGVGQLIADALDQGRRQFILGIGGSATNDGGAGMAAALGARFLDEQGQPVPPGAAGLLKLAKIDLSGLDPRLKKSRFRVACDVSNPLCGPRGAAYIFGPQKGAKPDQLPQLDQALRNLSRVVLRDLGKDITKIPGGGAAGGMGAGLIAFFDAQLAPGFQIVSQAAGFERQIAQLKPDVLITGEGRMDGQSAMGKLPVEAAKIAKKYGARVVAIVGSKGEGFEKAQEAGIDAIYELKTKDMTLEYAMVNAADLLREAVSQINFLPAKKEES